MRDLRTLSFVLPLVLATALGASAAVPTLAATASAEPAITVSPSTGLAGGDPVAVEANGLPPGASVRVNQCEPRNDSDYVCPDIATVTADAAGRLSTTVVLADPVWRSRPFGHASPVYCRADVCRLLLSWTDASGSEQTVSSDALEFTGSPATLEASPSTGLRRVQRVRVHGTAFGAEGRTVTVVQELCHDIVQDTGCGGAVLLRTGTVRADGTFAFPVKARRFMSEGTTPEQVHDCAIWEFLNWCQLTAHVLDATGQIDESFGASSFGDPGVILTGNFRT
jgi:hypothetical protein